MNTEIPAVIKSYEKAIVNNTSELFEEYFLEDATVSDAGKTYSGMQEIKEWGDELSKLALNTKITSVEANGDIVRINTYVEGNFKNSPLPFVYSIILENEKIKSLNIKVDR